MDLKAPVSTIMTPQPMCVHPDDPIAKIDELFRTHRIHHVPVIDEEKHVVGIISKSDFLYLLRGFTENETDRFRREAMLRAFKAWEIMHGEVETIREETPIKNAVSLLSQNRYRCLPVLNVQEELVGIVPTHDIIDMVNREA